jgi:hypothetical protein
MARKIQRVRKRSRNESLPGAASEAGWGEALDCPRSTGDWVISSDLVNPELVGSEKGDQDPFSGQIVTDIGRSLYLPYENRDIEIGLDPIDGGVTPTREEEPSLLKRNETVQPHLRNRKQLEPFSLGGHPEDLP